MTTTLVTFDGGTSGSNLVAGQNGIESTPDTLLPKFGSGIHNIGVVAGNSSNTADARFRVDLGLSGDHYGSTYMYYGTAHASSGNFVTFLSWVNSSNSIMASVRVGGSRELNIRVGASTIVRAGSANEVPLNAWFRFDWQVTGTTINWRLFASPEAASTSTPTLSGTFTFTAATISRVVLGPSASQAITKNWSYDTVRATNTATWYGPYGSGVLAGGAQTISPTQTLTRTATEPSGSTITARKWEIVSGPMGAGTTIGTAAALSWKPGSSPAGTVDIRQPVFQEMAYQLTSTAENSTVDWTTAYKYIEDIHDNRGYTAGIVGFCSATGDMLQLLQQYAIDKPSGNTLTPYISGVQACTTVGVGANASSAAASNLGTPFINAWIAAANGDPIFRKVQRDLRKSMYWDDALVQALADGVSPLGLAIYYDVLVNHGPGTDSESFGGILSYVRANSTKPSSGGNMTTWLNAIIDRRNTILVGWGDTDAAATGRVFFHRLLVNGGTVNGTAQAANLNLTTPFKFTCYGDLYTISTRPDPAADSILGTYVLQYTATGAGSDQASITVAQAAPTVTVWKNGVEVAATMKVWNGTAEVAIGSIAKN